MNLPAELGALGISLSTELGALGISLTAVGSSLVSYYLLRKRMEKVEERARGIDEKMEEMRIVEIFNESNSEDLSENLKGFSQRLFHILKSKYDLEHVTTYEEMISELEEKNVEDTESKEDALNLFNFLMNLEYSDKQPSKEEKSQARKAAFSLVRKAGPALRKPENSTAKE